MRYGSKRELLDDITAEHAALCALLESVPESRYRESGVWGDAWTVHDLVAHLAEWQAMFLKWFDEGRRGGEPAMPAPGYKWNQLPELNRVIQEKHHERTREAVWADFAGTYDRVLRLTRRLSEDDLLVPGRIAWTRKNPLTSYLGPNTASHYRFAAKVLRRWLSGRTRPRGASPGR